jgi:hypothetical protein
MMYVVARMLARFTRAGFSARLQAARKRVVVPAGNTSGESR